jgi:adenine-specific DNA-methyltransferase
MIYPRLLLARDLLRKDGVIFISIDDSELAHLRVVCDEIFGSENFCGVIKRRASRKTAFLSKRMTDMCDYVVAYVRSELAAPLSAGQVSDGTRPVFNEGNAIATRFLRAGACAKCADGTYPSGKHAARSLSFELLDELIVVGGKVERDVRISGPWRINQDVLDKTMFVTKNFGLRRVMLPEELDQAKLLNDLLDDPACYNEKGSEEIASIFGSSVFSYPKPRGLIDYLCAAAGVKGEDIVLDFFAGSGTTGHSILAQNAADGENRRFILVQLPEALNPNEKVQKIAADFCDKAGKPLNIAELTKERLRRAVVSLQPEGEAKNLFPGFRVFRLDISNIIAWTPNLVDIQRSLFDYQDNIRSGRSVDDILFELLIRFGLDLCVPIESQEIAGLQVSTVGAGALFVCLASTIDQDKVEHLASGLVSWRNKFDPAGDPVVLFIDNAFENDIAKSNLTAILNQNGLPNIRCL